MNLENKLEQLNTEYLDKECVNNTNKIKYKVIRISIDECPTEKTKQIIISSEAVDDVIVGKSHSAEFSIFLRDFTFL